MKTEIISIGDELLIGQVLNTNAHWLSGKLIENGFQVQRVTTLPDNKDTIAEALNRANNRSEFVFITGGLGPTNDDVTRAAIAEYFSVDWEVNEAVFNRIKQYLEERGYSISHHNEEQAKTPKGARIYMNYSGTAPGILLKKKDTRFIFMPGVHFEMKRLISESILPELKEKFIKEKLINQVVITQGIPEAHLAGRLKDWEAGLPGNIRLAYLPGPGIVKLRLSGKDKNSERLQDIIHEKIEELRKIIPEYFVVADDTSLEKVIGKLLTANNFTISTAESCTGGGIAASLTSVSGSSAYFKGSIVAYSNEIKQKMLSVPPEIIEKYGAVSKEVTESMGRSIMNLYETDCAIAVSGIAGPTGGTDEKPVGTTWISVCFKDEIASQHFVFGKLRDVNIQKTINTSLNMLRKLIIQKK